ncbi:MAG TPA: GntR family transcriptional regulator [Gammaproteobacteria bacterium]|jgi:DNA-binding GntR family transcriptional regulator|nr:GntR family transcriptional regulator [Gammaproteobacteria bacterium]
MDSGFSHTQDKQPKTLADRVYTQLRAAILDGDLEPGSKISEPELAKTYGVSRSSLREAIAKLESSNLVERQANLGARVISLSNASLLEIYQVRESLEGLAARLAAQHMTTAELDNMHELLAHQRSFCKPIAEKKYQSLDFDFHSSIVLGSHNQRLIRILSRDLFELVHFYRRKFSGSGPRPDQALIEHSEIVAAITRRDGEMAEVMMRHHIRAAREHAKKSFTDDSSLTA